MIKTAKEIVNESPVTKYLIKKLNDLKIEQRGCWEEDIPEEIWKEHIDGNIKATGLDIDPHRWYETAVDVFECEDGFIGVRHVNKTYSEMQDIPSLMWELSFFEMKEVKTVTYKPID